MNFNERQSLEGKNKASEAKGKGFTLTGVWHLRPSLVISMVILNGMNHYEVHKEHLSSRY